MADPNTGMSNHWYSFDEARFKSREDYTKMVKKVHSQEDSEEDLEEVTLAAHFYCNCFQSQ